MRLDEIRLDGGTQSRARMSEDTIREYADALKEGAKFPPVVVFNDGKQYWLADGFNRYYAHKAIGRDNIDIDIKSGTQLDARMYAAGANATHGQRRTSADKRHAILMMLNEPELKGSSEREIARICNVSHTLVQLVRKSLATLPPDQVAKKPPKKQLPKQEEPEYDPADEMRETIAVLNEELEKANRAAAAGVLADDMENAQQIMERQAEEIKILKAENDGLKATRDTMMVEIRELKKQCAYYQKKLKGFEK